MKTIFIPFIAFCAIIILISGCAHHSTDFAFFSGAGYKDLEMAKADGIEKTIPLSYDTAYDKVSALIKDQGLINFKRSKKRGYIVAMGFPLQVNTTRVGIFFEKAGENSTKITVSSLSDGAVKKADELILIPLESTE